MRPVPVSTGASARQYREPVPVSTGSLGLGAVYRPVLGAVYRPVLGAVYRPCRSQWRMHQYGTRAHDQIDGFEARSMDQWDGVR